MIADMATPSRQNLPSYIPQQPSSYQRGNPNPNPKFSAMKGRKPMATISTNIDSKLAVKKKKKAKGEKDPNKPKRPPSAFFVFMEGFRKKYKVVNPNNKSIAAVGKAGGEKWKSMPESEKAAFFSKAEKLKEDYQKKMADYKKGQNVMEEIESSEVHDEEEEEEAD